MKTIMVDGVEMDVCPKSISVGVNKSDNGDGVWVYEPDGVYTIVFVVGNTALAYFYQKQLSREAVTIKIGDEAFQGTIDSWKMPAEYSPITFDFVGQKI